MVEKSRMMVFGFKSLISTIFYLKTSKKHPKNLNKSIYGIK